MNSLSLFPLSMRAGHAANARQRRLRLLPCWLVLMMCGLGPCIVLADQESPPEMWVRASPNHRFLFKMVPAVWDTAGRPTMKSEAYGVAYAMDAQGDLQELWRSEGWYTFEGLLADDGRHFVRMGLWPRDQEHHTDLALAFYKDGKLIRQYQVRELLKDPAKASNSVSHYQWRAGIFPLTDGLQADGTFQLVLCDKTVHHFDITTGAVVRTTFATWLKTSEEQEAEKRAKEWQEEDLRKDALYAGSSLHSEYAAHFDRTITHLTSGAWGNNNVEGLRVYLDVRKKRAVKCEVMVWMPPDSSGKLSVGIPAVQLESVLDAALAHPYLAKRIENEEIRRVRLFTHGTLLHSNVKELQDALEEARPDRTFQPEELQAWAELLIDDGSSIFEPRAYFNTKTGELIYSADIQGFRRERGGQVVLYDAKGKASKIKTRSQLTAEARDVFSQQAQAFLDSAAFQKDYGPRFKIGHPEVPDPFNPEADMSTSPWCVGLKPLQPPAPGCTVRAQLTMAEVKKTGLALKAAEVEKALQLALEHPVVKRLRGDGQQGRVYLTISHDRLHWDTADLRSHLGHVLDAIPADGQLKPWAELRIQGPDASAPPELVYFNTQTRELVETAVYVPVAAPVISGVPADPFASVSRGSGSERLDVLWNAQGEAVGRQKGDGKPPADPFAQ